MPLLVIAFVERHLPPGSLNKVKVLILRSAWEHTSYATIAREENYDVDYIKKSASQLWKLIAKQLQTDVDVKTKVKVSKKNFRSFLLQYIEQSGYSNGQLQPKINNQPIQQWGTAPDVSCFYGRHTEITQLQNWIVTEKSRLVALLGIGGIGKTSLSVKIARELAPNFDYVIWRSLRNAPLLKDTIAELISLFSQQQDNRSSISLLLDYLRSHRCLIVLDNFETILQGGKTGYYLTDYENYGELLRVISEANHQSCLVITSREKPPELTSFEGSQVSTHLLFLQGCLQTTQGILDSKAIVGTTNQKQQLSQCYSHNLGC